MVEQLVVIDYIKIKVDCSDTNLKHWDWRTGTC
jgi:hypothetical protein